ncbi:IQCJ-SCHIP1 readthrough transcript protein-like isoform X2 [Crassostrea angulata]|nr:IQCJ-SCHIP1 readthrough transcript protein-like isoform X2 [Crassostrea angulata]
MSHSYQDDLSDLIQEEKRCSTLDNVDTNKLRNDRFERNLQTMMAADSEVAKKMFSAETCKPNTEKERAAIVIQKYFRGHLGRKKYLTLLCEEFEKEQSIMQLKIKEQMEEGELLVENHQLEVLLDDNITTRRNRSRHYLADIITIQRAWRSHRRKRAKMEAEDDTEKDNVTEKQERAPVSGVEERAPVSGVEERAPVSGVEERAPVSGAEERVPVSGAEERVPVSGAEERAPVSGVEERAPVSGAEEKSDSMSSSYSEISVSESSGQGLVEQDKVENGQNLVQCPGESEEDFNKRLRKVNYLSLAQEFAELQRKNSDAGLDGANTVGNNPTSAEGTASKTKSEPQATGENLADRGTEDFEVYTLETSFKPTFDWEDLEQKIQQATRSQSTLEQRNDRETIRKKLAMDSGAENEMFRTQPSFKKAYSAKPANTNLQICFMNEEQEGSNPPPTQSTDKSNTNRREILNGCGNTTNKEEGEDKTFLMKQVKLQQEAKIALAQASTMAHMQLEVEKEMKKKTANKNMVAVPFLESIKHNKVMKEELYIMNLGQLQVLVEDLHTQIENLNEDLMNLLMERDELHMSQDSMLVDIEDLTR